MDRRRRTEQLTMRRFSTPFTLSIVLASTAARAEPYIALRTGLACSACHLNRTGGGGRTSYGAGHGATVLPWKKILGERGLFDGSLGSRVRLGADLRAGYLGHLREEGPYLGELKVNEANLYLGVDLLPERLSVYVDESVAPGGATNREAFALYAAPVAGLYVKAGKFFLPFGLRLYDDDAATRRGTGFTFESSDVGAEIGAGGEHWTVAGAISNGTSGGAEEDNLKQYTATAAWIHPSGRIGLSLSRNERPQDSHHDVVGLYGGFAAPRVVVLAEIDEVTDHPAQGGDTHDRTGHVEADIDPGAGFTLRAWMGALEDHRPDGVSRFTQWGAGADWTPIPGLQIRLAYRARGADPGVPGSGDDEALAEVHVYF